jgi:hypothetical protein
LSDNDPGRVQVYALVEPTERAAIRCRRFRVGDALDLESCRGMDRSGPRVSPRATPTTPNGIRRIVLTLTHRVATILIRNRLTCPPTTLPHYPDIGTSVRPP